MAGEDSKSSLWKAVSAAIGSVMVEVRENGMQKLPESFVKNALGLAHIGSGGLITGGIDNIHALLTIIRLLNMLKDRLDVKDPTKLLIGAIAITQVQKRNEIEKIKALNRTRKGPVKTKMKQKLLKRLVVYMNYSAGAYGKEFLRTKSNVLKTKKEKEKIVDFESAMMYMTGCKRKEIIKWADTGVLYKPGYAVVANHSHGKIIVAIRGTDSLQDGIVDVVCEQQEHTFECEKFGETHGKVHTGFLVSAKYIHHEVKSLVEDLLEKYPKYDVVVTGHSLGAGVTTVLTLMWANEPRIKERNLHGYAFASPGSLSMELANSKLCRHYVTAVVNNDDVVCRLGISTLKDAQKAMVALAKKNSLSLEDKVDLYNELEREGNELKLFPGGQVWLFESALYDNQPVEIDPVEHCNEILLTTTFISNHMPEEYLKVLDRAPAK